MLLQSRLTVHDRGRTTFLLRSSQVRASVSATPASAALSVPTQTSILQLLAVVPSLQSPGEARWPGSRR